MTCEDIRDVLDMYLDGELSQDAAQEVVSHLAQCRACIAECAERGQAARAIRELPPMAAPEGLLDALLAAVVRPAKRLSCEAVRAELAAYADGEASKRLAVSLRIHLASCQSCARALERQHEARAVARALGPVPADADLLPRVMAALPRPVEGKLQRVRPSRVPLLVPGLRYAFAAAAAGAVVMGMVWWAVPGLGGLEARAPRAVLTAPLSAPVPVAVLPGTRPAAEQLAGVSRGEPRRRVASVEEVASLARSPRFLPAGAGAAVQPFAGPEPSRAPDGRAGGEAVQPVASPPAAPERGPAVAAPETRPSATPERPGAGLEVTGGWVESRTGPSAPEITVAGRPPVPPVTAPAVAVEPVAPPPSVAPPRTPISPPGIRPPAPPRGEDLTAPLIVRVTSLPSQPAVGTEAGRGSRVIPLAFAEREPGRTGLVNTPGGPVFLFGRASGSW